MKNIFISGITGMALLLSTSMPTQAKRMNPLTAFVLGGLVTAVIVHEHRDKNNYHRDNNYNNDYQRNESRVCVERVWVPANSIWVNGHWDHGFYVDGHYIRRNGYYENTRYSC